MDFHLGGYAAFLLLAYNSMENACGGLTSTLMFFKCFSHFFCYLCSAVAEANLPERREPDKLG